MTDAPRRRAGVALALLGALIANPLHAQLPDPEWHIPAVATSTAPSHPEYKALAAALLIEQEKARAAEPPPVEAGPLLRVGMRDARVAQLRDRLRHSGDYTTEMGADPWYFDAGIDAALRRLQARHVLVPDGQLGERTLAAVNRSAASRADQIEVALERWRWLPRDLAGDYIWVNIPRAQLDLVEDGVTTLSMRVVVGHRERSTPSLSGQLNRVTFNPTWSVPARIAVEDLLPRQRENPEFLATNGFRVLAAGGRALAPRSIDWSGIDASRFPYRLVQAPGPTNSLGRIRLSFYNPYDIYLHDTPSRGLFSLMTRLLSSGCVRLEDAARLTTALIARERPWTAGDTEAATAASATRNINLRVGLPVYLVYITTWIESGELRFGHDLYGRDPPVLAALRDTAAMADQKP